LNELFLPSLIAVLVQAAGACLLASLCVVLYRTARSTALGFWAAAWLSLFAAVSCLWAAFVSPSLRAPAEFICVLGEYLFGYLLLAGCWIYAGFTGPSKRELWLLLPGAILAWSLPRANARGFNAFFVVHTLIVGVFFLAALRVTRSVSGTRRRLPGLRVMEVALALLALDYFQYAPVFAFSRLRGEPPPTYWEYSPLYDLLFEVMLMFGMVIVVTGDIQHDLEAANRNLAQARDRFAAMAQIDHLTSAFNRHVFHALVGSRQGPEGANVRGCVAMIDIDDLKAVNDHYGHMTGDAAIRAVSGAIRACIRADDLLFRWGGDEFLVVLFGATEPEARDRFRHLGAGLKQTNLAGLSRPIDLSAAVGLAPFAEATSVDDVIALADAMMYGAKKRQLLT
jgi:diguanylate cyclase (GGDEF)-like protein